MAINHQEFAAAHPRPAANADSATRAQLADLATPRLNSSFWGLAAKAGQSPVELGRRSKRCDRDRFMPHTYWPVAQSAGEGTGAVKENALKHPRSVLLQPEAARTVQPLNEFKSLAKGSWHSSAVAVVTVAPRRHLGHRFLGLSERLACYCIGGGTGLGGRLFQPLSSDPLRTNGISGISPTRLRSLCKIRSGQPLYSHRQKVAQGRMI